MTLHGKLVDDCSLMARGAGAIIRKAYDQISTVSQKGAIDLVTDTDHAAEKHILDYLSQHYSDSPVLAEESGTREGNGSVRWIVDPLDGTVNFAHRIPHFCVLVSAQVQDEDGQWMTVAGATYEPMRDEMFLSEKGQGASLNGQTIQVTAKTDLIESLLTTGFGYERLFKAQDNHAEFCRMNLLTRGVRRLGSAGLDLAYVAAGRFDGFWEYALNPWDQAAGLLLVREAGGEVTQLDGQSAGIDATSVVAAGPGLHPKMLKALESSAEHSVNSRDGLEVFLPSELAKRLRDEWAL